MNKLKKLLRQDANKIMPSPALKQRIKESLNINDPAQVAERAQAAAVSEGSEARGYKHRRSWLSLRVLAAACLVILIGVAAVFAAQAFLGQTPPSGSYINVYAGASVLIETDEQDKVIAVTPVNKEAAVMLYDETVTGDVSAVTKKIVRLAIEYGFTDGSEIKLNVINDNAKKESKLFETLKAAAQSALSEKEISGTITRLGAYDQKEAAKLKVTPGKYALIKGVAQRVEGRKIEDIKNLTPAELYKLLEDDADEPIEEIKNKIAEQLQNDTALADYLAAAQAVKDKYEDALASLAGLRTISDNSRLEQAIRDFNNDFPDYKITLPSSNTPGGENREKSLRNLINEKAKQLSEALNSELAEVKARFSGIESDLKGLKENFINNILRPDYGNDTSYWDLGREKLNNNSGKNQGGNNQNGNNQNGNNQNGNNQNGNNNESEENDDTNDNIG